MADIFNNIKKLEQRRGTTYQMRRPFLINPLDGQVYIGPEGGDHSDIYPRVGINVDWIRGYYLTPLKALTWWDEPVSQGSKDAAINAFEAHRMRVEDSHFPFYLMKDALNLVIQGRKREVAALVRSAKRTMTRHDMWARNIGLRYDYDEDIGGYMSHREELLERAVEFLYELDPETYGKALAKVINRHGITALKDPRFLHKNPVVVPKRSAAYKFVKKAAYKTSRLLRKRIF